MVGIRDGLEVQPVVLVQGLEADPVLNVELGACHGLELRVHVDLLEVGAFSRVESHVHLELDKAQSVESGEALLVLVLLIMVSFIVDQRKE